MPLKVFIGASMLAAFGPATAQQGCPGCTSDDPASDYDSNILTGWSLSIEVTMTDGECYWGAVLGEPPDCMQGINCTAEVTTTWSGLSGAAPTVGHTTGAGRTYEEEVDASAMQLLLGFGSDTQSYGGQGPGKLLECGTGLTWHASLHNM